MKSLKNIVLAIGSAMTGIFDLTPTGRVIRKDPPTKVSWGNRACSENEHERRHQAAQDKRDRRAERNRRLHDHVQ